VHTASRVPEPPLVRRALALERELGFERSSIPEVGRLLHLLAAQRGRSRVGELGTGCGVGAAWMVSALPPSVPFVTVERDERLAAAAAELFAGDANVRVLQGDWHELMPQEAPFDLLFLDSGKQHPEIDGDDVIASWHRARRSSWTTSHRRGGGRMRCASSGSPTRRSPPSRS
jgi:predicted O-methyltransferase YrrM